MNFNGGFIQNWTNCYFSTKKLLFDLFKGRWCQKFVSLHMFLSIACLTYYYYFLYVSYLKALANLGVFRPSSFSLLSVDKSGFCWLIRLMTLVVLDLGSVLIYWSGCGSSLPNVYAKVKFLLVRSSEPSVLHLRSSTSSASEMSAMSITSSTILILFVKPVGVALVGRIIWLRSSFSFNFA